MWAILGGLGGLFVALNNWLCRRLTREAKKLTQQDQGAERYSTVGPQFRSLIDEFDTWPWLMFLYSGGGLSIGILLGTGRAHDRWVFAAIMTGANLFKLYGTNIRRRGPLLRANLARVMFLLNRSEKADRKAAVAASG